jgi:hypothetical protein
MSFHRITLSQTFRGRTFQNVFHVLNPDGLINDQTIALTVEQHWIEHFRGCQFTNMQYHQIIIQRLFDNPAPAPFVKNISIAPNGSLTAALGILSWKLHFRTGLAGRKHRGRYFVAGIANGFIDLSTERVGLGTATTFMTNLVNTLTDKWCGGPNTIGLHLVVAHKDNSTPTLCTRIDFDTLPSALRSRRVGIGI